MCAGEGQLDQMASHVQKYNVTLYIPPNWRIVDYNPLEIGMALILKIECLGLNHLMETLKEVNNGKIALLDGELIDNVYQMMVVCLPCRLLGHAMEDVGAWNISSIGETTNIFNVATRLLASDGVIILIGIMSSLLHLVTTGFVNLWKVIGSQAIHCTTPICVQEGREVCACIM